MMLLREAASPIVWGAEGNAPYGAGVAGRGALK